MTSDDLLFTQFTWGIKDPFPEGFLLTSCVVLTKLLDSINFGFLICEMGAMISPTSQSYCEVLTLQAVGR